VNYIPPFELIRRSVDITTERGELRVTVSYDEFIKLLKLMIAGAKVDETWYLRTYEDIGGAVKEGVLPSGRHHFVNDGYFEGRLPSALKVDEAWYLKQYPDVAECVRAGTIASAQAHFDKDGYREGRLPFPL